MNNKQCPVICFISLLLFWLLWSSQIQSNTYKHVYFGCKIRLFDADSLLRPPPPSSGILRNCDIWEPGVKVWNKDLFLILDFCSEIRNSWGNIWMNCSWAQWSLSQDSLKSLSFVGMKHYSGMLTTRLQKVSDTRLREGSVFVLTNWDFCVVLPPLGPKRIPGVGKSCHLLLKECQKRSFCLPF